MKLLLLLLFPILSTAQYNFTKEEIDHAYNEREMYRFNAAKWESTAMLNQSVIDKLANEMAGVSDSLLTAINERDELKRQHEADMVKLARSEKKYGIAIYAGYGASVYSGDVKLAPSVGVCIYRTILKF